MTRPLSLETGPLPSPKRMDFLHSGHETPRNSHLNVSIAQDAEDPALEGACLFLTRPPHSLLEGLGLCWQHDRPSDCWTGPQKGQGNPSVTSLSCPSVLASPEPLLFPLLPGPGGSAIQPLSSYSPHPRLCPRTATGNQWDIGTCIHMAHLGRRN